MLFSLIISVYNVEKYLITCLKSVLNQSYFNYLDYEIIIVYDHGSDGSLSIIERFEKQFKCKFTLIKNETKQGLGPSRNSGLSVAVGKYIIFIDGDDWIEIDYLAKLKGIIEANNYPDLIRICYGKECSGFSKRIKTFDDDIPIEEIKFQILTDDLGSQSWLNICKKDLYKDIVFPNTYYEDMPVTFKLYFMAKSIIMLEYYGYHYVQRFNSLSYNPSPEKPYGSYLGFKSKLSFAKEKKLAKQIDVLLKKYNESSIFCLHGLAAEPTKQNRQLIKMVAREVINENKEQKNKYIKGKTQLRIAIISSSLYCYICRIAKLIRRN